MTSHATLTTHTATDHCDARRIVAARTTVTGGLIGAVLAWASTLGIYLVGNLGAPVRVVTGWAPDGADLSVADVTVTVLAAVAAGAVVLGVIQPRYTGAWKAWTTLATLVAVASAIPLTRLDVDRGSKIALASMHLVTGAAAITGHAIARQRAARTSQQS